MDGLGSGLDAVFTATGMLPSSGMAPAAGMVRGGAVALHPKSWPCLWLGRVLIVALQVETQGSSPRAVDPMLRSCPGPKAELFKQLLSRLPGVINFR